MSAHPCWARLARHLHPRPAGMYLSNSRTAGFVPPDTALPPRFGKLSDVFKDIPFDNDLAAGIQRHDWFSRPTAGGEGGSRAGLSQHAGQPLRRTHATLGCACCSLLPMPNDSDVRMLAASPGSGRNVARPGRAESDFETAYNSFKSKPGGITIGITTRDGGRGWPRSIAVA